MKKQRQEAEQAVLGGAVVNTVKETAKKRRVSSNFKSDCECTLKFKWDPTDINNSHKWLCIINITERDL